MTTCNEAEAFLYEVRGTIEQRVGEQLRRRVAINPRTDHAKVIDLQMSDERNRMRRALQSVEAYDAVADLDDWLLYLAKQMKERQRW